MATAQLDVWRNMQSKLAAMGYVKATIIGEPRSTYQAGLVAIIPRDGEVTEWVLNAPREMHRVMLRMYQPAEGEPQEDTEATLDQFRADILEDIAGDFDLGGTVAYPYEGEHPRWEYSIEEAQNQKWRVLEFTLAYTFDVAYTAAA